MTVRSIVDSEESEIGEVIAETIPPQTGSQTEPILKLEKTFNSTAVFVVSPPEANSFCEVNNILKQAKES